MEAITRSGRDGPDVISAPHSLDWLLIFGPRYAERVLTEWFEHYNQARPHRALELRTPIARSDPVATVGPIVCRERVGGLLREYSRQPMPAAA